VLDPPGHDQLRRRGGVEQLHRLPSEIVTLASLRRVADEEHESLVQRQPEALP
jgi:hypothetical protein